MYIHKFKVQSADESEIDEQLRPEKYVYITRAS